MSNQTINLSPDLYRYMLDISLREAEVLKALREETARLPNGKPRSSSFWTRIGNIHVHILRRRLIL